MSRLIDLMNIAFLILNIKLAGPAIFLLNWLKLLNCSNAFSWPISFIDQVEVFESMSKPLNLVLLYYKSVDKLKTYGIGVIEGTVLSFIIIWSLNTLLAKVLTTIEDSKFYN